jgi:hypothetical protein
MQPAQAQLSQVEEPGLRLGLGGNPTFRLGFAIEQCRFCHVRPPLARSPSPEPRRRDEGSMLVECLCEGIDRLPSLSVAYGF